jgi:hypothetical protein
MDRSSLEAMSRDDLIERAESFGVRRARIMTRPELIDEILLASFGREEKERDKKKLERARGLFGRARDLLARVVDKGLHLPDAADRIRSMPLPPPPSARTTPSVLPTVTLAEIYAAQGHTGRAIDTLEKVLATEPEHAAASALLDKLRSADYRAPAQPDLGPEEPPPAADFDIADDVTSAPVLERPREEPPSAEPPSIEAGPSTRAATEVNVDVADACTAIPTARGELVVRWTISRKSRLHHETRAPGGRLALRIATVVPTHDGPRSSVRDELVEPSERERLLAPVRGLAVRRVAIGWLDGVRFVPIAHAEDLVRDDAGAFARWTPNGLEPVAA